MINNQGQVTKKYIKGSENCREAITLQYEPYGSTRSFRYRLTINGELRRLHENGKFGLNPENIFELYYIQISLKSPATKENIEKCSEKLDIDFSKKDFESVPNYKCFFKCMMEVDEILVNETFSLERFKEVLQHDKELDEAGRAKTIRALPICFDEAKYINDLCNKSFNVVYCLHKVL